MTAAAAAEDALEAIDAEFRGWHAWRSGSGHWYAVRVGAKYHRTDPRPVTVDAESQAGLTEMLAEVDRWGLPGSA